MKTECISQANGTDLMCGHWDEERGTCRVCNLKANPSPIFIDGGFQPDSYESRVQASKGKKLPTIKKTRKP